jgi:colanic acid/amylovoran biosynthesis glycosyltransferase
VLQSPRFAFLIAQHPAINHAVILREVRLLREHLEIHTASIRAPDRPLDQLSPEELDEEKRTFYVKPAGAGAALASLFRAFWLNPLRFATSLFYAARLAGFRPGPSARNLAYFAEAAVVGIWLRQNHLTHLHTHYSSTVALLVQKTFGVEISISFHGPDEFNDPDGFWIREKVAACTFVRAISHYARSRLMISSAVSGWGKIEVAYMGVDPSAFTPRPLRPSPRPIEILCVGRLAPVKAQHILIAAVGLLRERKNVMLHLVGGGPDRKFLEGEVAARGIGESIIFHGFTPQDKLDGLYRQADIFALPSLAEGVPGVLMEAMAMEIPCVSTWITGIPELIRDGVDGLLVAPSDIEAFAAAIDRLIADADLRLRIGQAGRQRVLDKFDLRRNSSTLAAVMRHYSMKE